MPIGVRLNARKPEFSADDGDSLGARLRRRRRALGLGRVDAAVLIGTDEKSLMWWERDERIPFVSAYPGIIAYLGCEPWDEPQSLGETLRAERHRRGIEIRKAAALIGVDEGTLRRWERGEWKPTQLTLPALDTFLGYSTKARFPSDVR